MTTGPENPYGQQPGENQPDETQPYGRAVPDPEAPTEQQPPTYASGSTPPPPPPPYGQQPAPAYGAPAGAYGVSAAAPYGIHPMTGIPYSDKSKIVAGILQILLPFGIGRFYVGDTRIGVIQLIVTIVTCGIGSLWSVIDGIVMLVTDSKDVNGYVLRS
jgi:TM2 domain-containing membrane protein YozV